MYGEFQAEINKILQSGGSIANALQLAFGIPHDFAVAVAKTEGWWGEEGNQDEFATTMGSTAREQNAALLETFGEITNGFSALVTALQGEAPHAQQPQLYANEGIDEQMANGETKR
ncbi:hypothetical protein ACH4GE_37025 [Streptomyces tendae]|uniref:hypothetical protein n=1 Tax=Streptomyces tendae TaxID=1932 RepID=UPI0037BC1A80